MSVERAEVPAITISPDRRGWMIARCASDEVYTLTKMAESEAHKPTAQQHAAEAMLKRQELDELATINRLAFKVIKGGRDV